jgi:hypothetical protein
LVLESGIRAPEASAVGYLIEGLFYPAKAVVHIIQRHLHVRRIVSRLPPTSEHENAC